MQSYRPIPKQSGFSTAVILLAVLVVAVLAVTSVLVYQRHKPISAQHSAATSQTQTTSQSKNAATLAPPTDPYAGWKTYTSATEKLSFKYPSDWTTTDYSDRTATGKADSVELFNPSKSVAVFWNSQRGGVGGACDPSVFPGSAAAKTDSPGACPYFKVLDMQKLIGADLYYVGGIETHDGTHYSPWIALQDSNGLLTSRGDMGYLMFEGKNNGFTDGNGYVIKNNPAELIGGESNLPPFGDGGVSYLTESQAAAFFATPDSQTMKLILVSATY